MPVRYSLKFTLISDNKRFFASTHGTIANFIATLNVLKWKTKHKVNPKTWSAYKRTRDKKSRSDPLSNETLYGLINESGTPIFCTEPFYWWVQPSGCIFSVIEDIYLNILLGLFALFLACWVLIKLVGNQEWGLLLFRTFYC